MSTKIRFALAIEVILSLGLLGCSSISPDFSDMSQTYQRTIEKYQNNNLLLNIVRSSKNLPLSFIDIPSVIGTGNVSETAGLSGLIYSASAGSGVSGLFSAAAGGGYTPSYYMPSLSLTLGRSFNFTQSSMENAQFQKEFLSTIPIQTIHYFNKRHTPREFIFTLVIDEIAIREPDGTTKVYYNNPTVGNFSEFQVLLRKLVDDGLTTEILKRDSPVGPPLDIAKMEPALGTVIMQFLGAKDKDKLNFKPVSDKNPKEYQITQEKEIARFCFNPNVNSMNVEREFGDTMFCQSSLSNAKEKIENIGITGTTSKDKTKKSISLNLRSNKDVYRYLGEVFIAQSQGDARMEFLRTPARSGISKDSQEAMQIPLLVIKKNPEIFTKSISSIEYDGEIYSIPSENSGYSAMVLDILSQFLSLNKVPGSIPPSPAVIVK
jgi:hypothetical protein